MLGSVAVVSYSAALFAFAAISILLATRWRARLYSRLLMTACLMSAVWAGFVVLSVFASHPFSFAADVLEIARNASLTFFLLRLVAPDSDDVTAVAPMRSARFVFFSLYLLLLAITLYGYAQPAFRQSEGGGLILVVGRIASAVMGMVFVEQLFRNSASEDRWGIKFACLGIGGLFAYDFYLYSDALLFRKLNIEIWVARGMINALIVPLIVVSILRSPQWTPRLAVSRQILMHSATISGAAAYLLLMAAAGYYLRYFGGSWGPIMQAAFLFAALMLLMGTLFSGTFRSRLKVFISKHFYNYNYDYREEWLRFTRTLSERGPGLEQRAIRAIADLVESRAGILFIKNDAQVFSATTSWNIALTPMQEAGDTAFSQFMLARHWVIDLPELVRDPARYDSLTLPSWLQSLPEAWLVVPLVLQADLIGFVVLTESRSKIKLNWEVLDLLKIAGNQAAGSLVQKSASDALMVARQFESYTRMSTFVVHDLKNLVSQLSLLVLNAERHRDSPEFQQDMLDTVSHSVDRMKVLLQKFSRGSSLERPAPILIEQVTTRAIASKAAGVPQPSIEVVERGLIVYANQARLERVIGHLIQNAMEATPRDGEIAIRLVREGRSVVLELTDNGQGMSKEFIRERLFKPFESTKLAGMGIGVFESREYIHELGGTLEVTSVPDQGTRFRIALPLHDDDDFSVLNATS
ncbi:MAG: PEP-CTERM system histidine kinase PrsK [Herminiimonas sp.]|nr:PEP-CTERM system histidine kinase PrsK [Herminiimonas sp.]